MHHNEQMAGTILFYPAQQDYCLYTFLTTYIFFYFLCTTYSGVTVLKIKLN